jgi:magnesium transporter
MYKRYIDQSSQILPIAIFSYPVLRLLNKNAPKGIDHVTRLYHKAEVQAWGPKYLCPSQNPANPARSSVIDWYSFPAAMRSLLHVPAPSSTLLKYLKLQSENIYFFSPNPRPGFTFDHAAPRGSQLCLPTAPEFSKSSCRSVSTAAPRRATTEASFINLEFLLPRLRTISKTETRSSHLPVRYKRRGCKGVGASRYSSTGGRKWYQKLWGRRSIKGGKPLHPDDLPSSLRGREDTSDTSMFSLGRHISAKAAAQPKLRCTELDENGNIVLTSGEFKKSELIQKV